MSAFSKMILNGLDKIGRKRIVLDRQSQEPYLERYYLFLKDRKRWPFNIFLHKFLKSDPTDLHDHPWPYSTLILKGGYWEIIPLGGGISRDFNNNLWTERIWRGPGHFRICPANSFHRVELEPGIECWTLFVPGPQQRNWGFDVSGKWVKNEDYLEGKKNERS